MNSVIVKFRLSLVKRGIWGTLRYCGVKVVGMPKYNLPSSRAARIRHKSKNEKFDRKHGLNTSESVIPEESSVEGGNWMHGTKHQPVSPVIFIAAIGRLKQPLDNFIFLDLGSGKGRALFLAAEYPFKGIVGVEYSSELVSVANENLNKYPLENKCCGSIEVINIDAEEYVFPNENIVLFLYNPFGFKVMSAVVENVIGSLKEWPREIIVVYINPEFSELWDHASDVKTEYDAYTVWTIGENV